MIFKVCISENTLTLQLYLLLSLTNPAIYGFKQRNSTPANSGVNSLLLFLLYIYLLDIYTTGTKVNSVIY